MSEIVEMKIKDGATIRIQLDEVAAPLSVANFLQLVNSGFYNGLTFHRIIPGFMIQGGDPDGTGMGGPKTRVKGEFSSNGWNNPLVHNKGVISMARSGDPDSAGSQFFLVHEDAPHLDGQYAAFGKVIEGIEEIDRIAKVPTDPSDRPLQDVVMESVSVVGGAGSV